MPRPTDVLGTPAQLARRLAFATAAGVFMGLIGPFGSYDVKPLQRVAAWLVSFWVGSLLFGAALKAAERWSARTGTPRWFARVTATALAAVPLAAVAAASFHWIGHVPASRMEWLTWYAQVLAIGLPTALGYMVLAPAVLKPAAPPPAVDPVPAEAAPDDRRGETLLDRLPARLGREVTALQMEDHYVRVHTPLGSDLLLTPMAQAVEALGAVEGLRVHRSWWVARRAVEGSAMDGRNLRLKLRGGIEAPVARTAVAQVRAAGWLGDGPGPP